MRRVILSVAVACSGLSSEACFGEPLARREIKSGTMPYATYSEGLLSRVEPTGWLHEALSRQRTGLTGHPSALCYPYDGCLWAGEIDRQGDHGEAWWRYEQTAYYSDGLLRLGYALKDSSMVERALKGVSYVLDNASPDGYLGSPSLWDESRFTLCDGREMWPMAVYFRVMKAAFEANPDRRIPLSLARYYKLYPAETICRNRNIVNVEGMTWAYGLTGDSELLSRAERAWKNAVPNRKGMQADWSGGLTPEDCLSDDPLYMHGVTYCEEMKVPLLLYAYSGKTEYLSQAENVLRKLVRDHLLPDGCPSSVEQTRGNAVCWGHETCDVSDFTWSLGYFLQVTGKAEYADLIERCVFNAGMGSVTKDFRALQYFSNLNQFISTCNSNPNPYRKGGTRSQYRPAHPTECCAGNVHRFLPNYVARMWLKDASGDPVAALYGPSEVDYGFVRIAEETKYPFDGKIRFRFSLPAPRKFGFSYRIPAWCRSHSKCGKFVRVERVFSDGDVLDVDFDMELKFQEVEPRRYVVRDLTVPKPMRLEGPREAQGVIVSRGPLLFAHAIRSRCEVDGVRHPELKGKWCAESGFKSWNMYPDSPFNYALVRSTGTVRTGGDCNCVFGEDGSPVVIDVPVRRIRWELDENRYTPDMPSCVLPLPDGEETITLVPYGATCLRLSVFPLLSQNVRR